MTTYNNIEDYNIVLDNLNDAIEAYNIAYNAYINPLKEFVVKKEKEEDTYLLVEVYHDGHDKEVSCFSASAKCMTYMLNSMTENIYKNADC